MTRVVWWKEPNITPICIRIWLMKITHVLLLLMEPVSFRSACDMRRAWRPTCESPISPSISARGTSAATESITTMSTAAERTSVSQIWRGLPHPLLSRDTRTERALHEEQPVHLEARLEARRVDQARGPVAGHPHTAHGEMRLEGVVGALRALPLSRGFARRRAE